MHLHFFSTPFFLCAWCGEEEKRQLLFCGDTRYLVWKNPFLKKKELS